MSNAATVQAIYEAFGRGDVATILDKLDDAVELETTVPVSDVPWLQARRGKANIAGFFESMAPLKITRFEPHDLRRRRQGVRAHHLRGYEPGQALLVSQQRSPVAVQHSW